MPIIHPSNIHAELHRQQLVHMGEDEKVLFSFKSLEAYTCIRRESLSLKTFRIQLCTWQNGIIFHLKFARNRYCEFQIVPFDFFGDRLLEMSQAFCVDISSNYTRPFLTYVQYSTVYCMVNQEHLYGSIRPFFTHFFTLFHEIARIEVTFYGDGVRDHMAYFLNPDAPWFVHKVTVREMETQELIESAMSGVQPTDEFDFTYIPSFPIKSPLKKIVVRDGNRFETERLPCLLAEEVHFWKISCEKVNHVLLRWKWEKNKMTERLRRIEMVVDDPMNVEKVLESLDPQEWDANRRNRFHYKIVEGKLQLEDLKDVPDIRQEGGRWATVFVQTDRQLDNSYHNKVILHVWEENQRPEFSKKELEQITRMTGRMILERDRKSEALEQKKLELDAKQREVEELTFRVARMELDMDKCSDDINKLNGIAPAE